MNLLPKHEVKFADKDYWNDFFKHRSKEFEWYGEYPELCSHLHKYIKPQDSTLVVGCGNSALSANLYDVGYRNLINIDVSPVVIKQMRHLHRERKEMRYEIMDALNMNFADNTFSVALDKGTLDALMPQDEEEDISRGRQLLEEIARVLKLGGRYIVISLLQPHILKLILDVYVNLGWLVRVCRCHEVEERTIEELGRLRMPVFMVVCTKFKKMEELPSILELNLGTLDEPYRVKDPSDIIRTVKEIQNTTAMCGAIQKQALNGEMELEFRREGDATPRYAINVVDAVGPSAKIRSYGAFIVPRGRETEWHFGSPEGRQLLQKSSGFDRLVVISLRRDHSYPSLEEIQRELGNSVVQLAPQGTNPQIPFLTIGEGIGSREIIHSGNSKFSGDFVVEDVEVFDDRFRRLVFLRNQSVIQSEAKLKLVPVKKKKDKKGVWHIDQNYVACTHHRYMALAVALLNVNPCNVLVIGLGGGGLCTFLRRVFPEVMITAVDIDPAMVEIAQKFFGITPDKQLKLVVADGMEYFNKCVKEGNKYNVIILDVDSKAEGNALSSPPADFVTIKALDAISKTLTEEGTLVVNMVCRVEEPKRKIVDDLKIRYPLVARYSLEEDVNELVYATRKQGIDEKKWRVQFEEAASMMNKDGRKKLSVNDNLLDLHHLFENLNIT